MPGMTGSCCEECADSGNASRAWRSNRTRLGPRPLWPGAISCGRGPTRRLLRGPERAGRRCAESGPDSWTDWRSPGSWIRSWRAGGGRGAPGPLVQDAAPGAERGPVHYGAPLEGTAVQACLPDRDGSGGLPILPGAQGRAAGQGGAGGAQELLRGNHAGTRDADADARAGVLRVCEGTVAVSGGDGGEGGWGGPTARPKTR